jgi:hypothetical protein
LSQLKTWFGIVTTRRSAVAPSPRSIALLNRIRGYTTHLNSDAEPFTWTATTDEILANVA